MDQESVVNIELPAEERRELVMLLSEQVEGRSCTEIRGLEILANNAARVLRARIEPTPVSARPG